MNTITSKQSKLAKAKYQEQYWPKTDDDANPVHGVAISVVRLAKTCQEHPNAMAPVPGEYDDSCLMVSLRKPPANWTYYPLVFENVRIFYRVSEVE